MCSLVARLYVIELLYLTQIAYGLQLYSPDLNRVLNYLQKQHDDRNSNEALFQEALHKGDLYSGQRNTHISQYSQDDREDRIASETAEVTYPGLDIKTLAKILSYKTQASENSGKPKLNHVPSDSRNSNNIQEYSKVYLVLDPQAKINTADAKRIGDIVSSLISSKRKLQTKQKPKTQARRYKGFVLMDDVFARRRNRDSKEKFSKDSIERDYKPKRVRSEYGGGGGRTAIPYIRHRGDIYEKE